MCFTGAALGYCDYLVSWERSNGNPRANRSEVIRKSLRARQIIRHDLRGTLDNLRLVREMLLADSKPTPQSNAGIADVIEAIHEQLSKLTDPADPEPMAGHLPRPEAS